MPPVLVSVEEFEAWLGELESGPPAQMQALLEMVEAELAADGGRSHRPFQAAQTDRVERKDGTGTQTLWLDYPVASLTSIKLGFDPTDPDETLDLTDLATLQWQAGKRRLVRVSGGCFGPAGAPGYVQVTYTTQADLPRIASLAVLDVAAQLWRRRGSEETTSQREGGHSRELATVKASSTVWQSALALGESPVG